MKIRHLLCSCFITTLLSFSCGGTPSGVSNNERGNPQRPTRAGGEQPLTGGIAEEIRSLIETGCLSSMRQALEIIRDRNLGDSDFGRMMNGIITVILRNVYPDTILRLPPPDLPLTDNYSRLITEAQRGNFIHPGEASDDFFEHILPLFAVNAGTGRETLAQALNLTVKAGEMRPNSVLPPYFRGFIHEISNQYPLAEAAYRQALVIYNDFYPSLVGIARVMKLSGRRPEAISLLSELAIRYPDNLSVKKQLAVIHYENRDQPRALQAIDEILIHEPGNGEFILMRAHILIEQSNFSGANLNLDTYSHINPNDRFYLFLRARSQAEGSRNRDSALNYLRTILRVNPNDQEVLVYAARLLMESTRTADHTEGREYLNRLQQTADFSADVLSLALRDAVQRESWQEAQGFLNRILAVRRTPRDLIDAYHIERALGNNARAFTFALELYNRNTSDNDYINIYISALIDNGRRNEAAAMIENRLAAVTSPGVKSQLFFLRSRLQTNEQAALGDLRSSLFEDPRNLEAHIAMFLIFHNRREERRAAQYLRQALAISPDNPRLRQYERQYSHLLGR